MYPIKSDKVSITSRFGNRTYKYQGKTVKDFHRGIDLIANPNNKNEEILAYEDGVVTSLRKQGKQYGDGCYVRIKHANGFYTLYFHMKSNTICVNVGDKVKKGQKIGIIGTTGISTGVHLHFQIDKGSNSTAVDPYDYLFNGKKLIEEIDDMEFKVGDYVYALEDVKLYTTVEYKENKYTLKKGEKAYIKYSKGNNIALADPNTKVYFPSAWTNQFDKLTKNEPQSDYKELYEKQLLITKDLEAQIKGLQDKINKAIQDLS